MDSCPWFCLQHFPMLRKYSSQHYMPCGICIIFCSRTSRTLITSTSSSMLQPPLTGRPVGPRFALDSRLAGIVLSCTLLPLRPVDPVGPVLQKVVLVPLHAPPLQESASCKSWVCCAVPAVRWYCRANC